MMFADAERIESRLLGNHRLFDDIAQHLRVREWLSAIARRNVAEGVNAELKRHCFIVTNCATSKTRPFATTFFTLVVFAMLASGSPSIAIRSASLPGSIVPPA